MSDKMRMNLYKILITLELINYQVVTILFNDFILFKFLRDILLFIILFNLVWRYYKNNSLYNLSFKSIITNHTILFITLFLMIFILLAALRTSSLSAIFVFIRKYLSPILLLISIIYEKNFNEENLNKILTYLFNLIFVLALWGIIQAHILGPKFLIDLGYPTKYSYAYQAITLKDSFYFGNLGIQRVVSTLSNSNVFALILGCSLIVFFLNQNKIILKRVDWIKFLTIVFAYFFTFSRANILAMIIVVILILWRYIPNKKYILCFSISIFLLFFTIYLFQDNNGLTHKLLNWMVSSLTFSESSASGRVAIWLTAFKKVLSNPLGIGFGKVGSWAQISGATEFYHCENSYLAITLDLGWLGLICYVCFILFLFINIKRYLKNNKKEVKIITAIIFYLMIAFMFSNHIYDKEAICIIYFLIGMLIKYKKEVLK